MARGGDDDDDDDDEDDVDVDGDVDVNFLLVAVAIVGEFIRPPVAFKVGFFCLGPNNTVGRVERTFSRAAKDETFPKFNNIESLSGSPWLGTCTRLEMTFPESKGTTILN